jgi:hypothetical protein
MLFYFCLSRLKGNLELRGEELRALRTELEECRTQILATSTQLVQLPNPRSPFIGFNLMVSLPLSLLREEN